ncbi:uncharacterized protein LOC141899063 [Tubulanus polymorphus]|uniref:uncharacterized protein LOC141899063 n=1 Tax=Tubulanus polymorphus TaxID=672921 RepID=UPI003DA46FD2
MSLSDDESASTQYDESATSSDHAEKIVAANFMDIRKNLNLHEFATPKPVDNVDQSEHMRVYLRIRPFLKEELEKKENQDCIIQETETSLFVHAPKDSITFKNTAHGCAKLNHKFSFSNIFNENTSQKVFFNQTTLSTVKDFVDGQNCLVFSHGVTSSGKTHTILGNPHDAGILPRSLDVVFNSIEGKQWTSMTLKPKLFCDVARLNANQIEVEKLVKQKVFAMASDDDKKCSDLLGDDVVSSTDSSISSIVNEDSTAKDSTSRESDIVNELQSDIETFEDLQNRERDDAIVDIGTQGDILFSVWVSFCEIYNEFIYDLLESVPKKKKAKRPSLKLSEDRNGNPYVKGLTWINVISADEAFQILNIGQRNLRIASTKLNHNSSRSHSIFSLKILRVVKKENPNMARISMLSFCDLAGSERSRKTQSKGERMKEAAHINTSLLTLGRCIENLRYNQHHKSNQKVIPFRESKLTRLFQSFFCGQGRASMIVNINQNASMFDETLHVLKFSAIAKQVYNVQKPEVPKVEPRYRALSLGLMSSVGKNTRARATSIAWCSPATQQKLLEEERLQKLQEEMKEKDVSVSEDLDVTLADTSFADRERELLDAIEFLQKQLVKERTEKVLVEARVREEVCAEMSEMFIKIEQECSERIEEERAAAEELAERKIEMYKKFVQPNRKRARLDNGNENEDVVEECVSVNQLKEVEDKLKERDFLVKQLEETVENLNMELESTKQRLINVTEDCDESRVVVSSLKFELADLKTKITEDNLSSSENKNTSGTPAARLNDTLAEICNNEIVERLSRQLEEAQSKLKDQEKETSELQAMLTEAGDAFLEKEIEIEKLKAAIIEDERRIEVQEQTVEEMKRVIAEGQKAMEIAEQKLLRRDEKLSKLEAGWEQLTSKLNEAQSVMEILKGTAMNHNSLQSLMLPSIINNFSPQFSSTKDADEIMHVANALCLSSGTKTARNRSKLSNDSNYQSGSGSRDSVRTFDGKSKEPHISQPELLSPPLVNVESLKDTPLISSAIDSKRPSLPPLIGCGHKQNIRVSSTCPRSVRKQPPSCNKVRHSPRTTVRYSSCLSPNDSNPMKNSNSTPTNKENLIHRRYTSPVVSPKTVENTTGVSQSEKAFHHLKEEYDSMQKAFEKSRLENSSLNEMCATLKERVEEKTKEDAMNQSTLHDLANEQHGIILELEKEKTLKEVANTKLSEQEKKLSEYENIIKQQEKTLKDVLSLKEKLEDEIEFEKACSKELRYQVNALEGKISDYQKDSHKDLDKIEELSARCHELTEELKLEQLSVLDLNSTMSQFSVMKQEVNDLKLKLQDVKQQLEDREKEFEIITIELKNEIAAKKKAENLLKNTLNMEKLVQNSQTVLSNNDRLNKELDEEHQLRITLEETITKLNIKIEGLQATLVKVVAESESLNTKAKEQCIVLQEHKETSQRIEKELKEEIAELKASAELTSYTNEETISDLQQKIEDNESKLEDVRNEKYSSDDEIKCLNTKITDLEQSLELIEAAKEQFSIKAQKLESQADIDKDCIECYCEKIKSMEETIANLSNQLSQESGEPKAYVVKVHELQVRLDESNQNVEFQTQIAKTLNDKNCLLAEDNQSLQKDIVELKKSCDNLEASLQEANKSYREREIKLSELKASHSSLSKRVTDLEKKSINDEMLIDDLQVDKDAIQIKLNEMLEKNTNLMSSYGAKEKEFLQHRSKVEETQAEYNEIIKNLKSELLEWKEKHHRSVNENQETTCSLNTDNQRLQSENVLLNKSNKELNGKISLLEAELEEIENFENETSVDVGELKEQCEQLKSKLAEMETTASRRNAKIVEKNQTIEDLTIKAETHLSLYENCLKEITGLKECLKEQEMVAEQQDEVIKTGDERISQLQKENQALQASEDLKIKEVEIKNLTELLKEREYSISSKDASLRSKGLDMEQWRDKCDELSKCLADKNREIDRLESLSETHLNSELALEREKWQKKISAKDQIIQELKDVNNKLQEKFKADKSDDGNMNETSHLLGVPSETNVVDLSTSVLSNISNTSHVSANSFVCQVDFDEPEYDSSAIKKRPNKQSTGRKQRSNEKEDHVTFSVQKSKTDTEPATKKKPGRRRLYTANPPILDATPAKQKAAADEAQARSTRTLRSSKKKTST